MLTYCIATENNQTDTISSVWTEDKNKAYRLFNYTKNLLAEMEAYGATVSIVVYNHDTHSIYAIETVTINKENAS